MDKEKVVGIPEFIAIDNVIDKEKDRLMRSLKSKEEKLRKEIDIARIKQTLIEFFQNHSDNYDEFRYLSEVDSLEDIKQVFSESTLLKKIHNNLKSTDEAPRLSEVDKDVTGLTQWTAEDQEIVNKLFFEVHQKDGLFGVYDLMDEIRDSNSAFPDLYFFHSLELIQVRNWEIYGTPGLDNEDQDQDVLRADAFWDMHNLKTFARLGIKLEGKLEVVGAGFSASGSYGPIYLGQMFKLDEEKNNSDLSQDFPIDIIFGSSAGGLYPVYYALWREASMRDPDRVPFTMTSMIQFLPNGLDGMNMLEEGDEIIKGFENASQRLIDIINESRQKSGEASMPDIKDLTYNDIGINIGVVASRRRGDGTYQQVVFSGDECICASLAGSSNPYNSQHVLGKIAGALSLGFLSSLGKKDVLTEVRFANNNWNDGQHTNINPLENALYFDPIEVSMNIGYPGAFEDSDLAAEDAFGAKTNNPLEHLAFLKGSSQGEDWDISTSAIRAIIGYHGEIDRGVINKVVTEYREFVSDYNANQGINNGSPISDEQMRGSIEVLDKYVFESMVNMMHSSGIEKGVRSVDLQFQDIIDKNPENKWEELIRKSIDEMFSIFIKFGKGWHFSMIPLICSLIVLEKLPLGSEAKEVIRRQINDKFSEFDLGGGFLGYEGEKYHEEIKAILKLEGLDPKIKDRLLDLYLVNVENNIRYYSGTGEFVEFLDRMSELNLGKERFTMIFNKYFAAYIYTGQVSEKDDYSDLLQKIRNHPSLGGKQVYISYLSLKNIDRNIQLTYGLLGPEALEDLKEYLLANDFDMSLFQNKKYATDGRRGNMHADFENAISAFQESHKIAKSLTGTSFDERIGSLRKYVLKNTYDYTGKIEGTAMEDTFNDEIIKIILEDVLNFFELDNYEKGEFIINHLRESAGHMGLHTLSRFVNFMSGLSMSHKMRLVSENPLFFRLYYRQIEEDDFLRGTPHHKEAKFLHPSILGSK